jgi:hypothetical protein
VYQPGTAALPDQVSLAAGSQVTRGASPHSRSRP